MKLQKCHKKVTKAPYEGYTFFLEWAFTIGILQSHNLLELSIASAVARTRLLCLEMELLTFSMHAAV